VLGSAGRSRSCDPGVTGAVVVTTETCTIIILVAVVTSLMALPTLRYAVGEIAETTGEKDREKAFSGS
jgi:hypothetical protein